MASRHTRTARRTPRRAPSIRVSGRTRVLPLGLARSLAVVLACAVLAACGGPPAPTSPGPSALAEAPAAAPTRASLGPEAPLAPARRQPTLTVAAAGTGFVDTDSRGVACLQFAWQGQRGAPDLGDGLSFEVQAVTVDPPLWRVVRDGCDGSRPWCVGLTLTSAQPLCQVALARLDAPETPEPTVPDAPAVPDAPDAPAVPARTGSVAALAGRLVCEPPVTALECADATAALAAEGGDALPLDPPEG